MRSAAPAASASAVHRSTPLIPVAMESELHHALQALLPLCALPDTQVAAMLSANAAVPDAYSAAVQAALQIAAAAPRATMGAALQPARSFSAPLRVSSNGVGSSAQNNNSSGSNSAGLLHKLLAGLAWILDSSPLATEDAQAASTTKTASAAVVPSISPLLLPALIALDALVAHSAPVRRALMDGSLLLRTLSRLSLEALAFESSLRSRIETDLFKPVLSGLEEELAASLDGARNVGERSLRLMIHLTAPAAETSSSEEETSQQQLQQGPGSVPPRAMLAALVNRLGSIVVAGPSKSPSVAAVGAAGQAADTQFMLALELLGNLVLRVPWINSLVQSNSAAAASSALVPAPPSNPMATSTTLSPLPLKALYRQLIACLSSAQMERVTHALRLVAHLALTETSSKLLLLNGATPQPASATRREKQGVMEGKLFNASNTEQTFELVFNIVLQAAGGVDATTAGSTEIQPSAALLQPALQILATLTTSPVLLRALGSYSGLQSNLKAIVRLIGRRVAAASSSPSTAASDAGLDSQVCRSLLSLLCSLLAHRSSSVSRVVALHLLVDAEALEVLLNQVAFSRDAQLAAETLELLRECNEVATEWHGSKASDSSSSSVASAFNLGALYMPHALSDQAALPSLARMLTTQAFRDAAHADSVARKDQARLEQSLRSENSMVATAVDASLSASVHSTFLVSLLHFLTPLLVADDALRCALEPHFLLSSGLISELVQSSTSASGETPHHREVFALLRLMAAFRADQSSALYEAYDEAMRTLLSLPAEAQSEIASLLGRSVALSSSVDRLCVEDALHFVSLCEKGALAQLASGLQRFNRSASRDGSQLSATLAAERAAHASLMASFADQRSSVHSSSVASADREKELLRRLADSEAKAARQKEEYESRLERQQEQHEAELRSVQAHSAEALSELQSRLEQQESFASAQALSHSELLSRSESDLAAALTRASAAEVAFADVSRRHQSLSRKLAEAGKAYEAQLDYASKLKAENASLRTEAQSHLDALQTDLSAAQKALSSSSAHNIDLSAKLEDAWGKLVLLNRALGESQKDLQARIQRENQQDVRLRQLHAEVARLGAEHAQATQALRQREGEIAALDAALTDSAVERDELQAVNVDLKTELAAVSESEQTASERCAELSSSVDELRAQIASLQSEASESSAARSAQSARLEAAEAELKQHHQLAAMIHKLSGQAAAASNGATTR